MIRTRLDGKVLKVDIEGSEPDALRAAAADLSPAGRVAVEYHGEIAPGCLELVTDALRPSGFGLIEDFEGRNRPDEGLGLSGRHGRLCRELSGRS